MLTNIRSNSATLIDTELRIIEKLQMEIDEEAKALREQYYAEKEILYQKEVDRLTGELNDQDKARGRAYAPLNLMVRVDDDRLEISWWTRHMAKKAKGASGTSHVIKRRVPWGTGRSKNQAGYYLPALLRHAKKWEVDLVRRVEAHAATLREARTGLLDLRGRWSVYRRILDRNFQFAVDAGTSVAAEAASHAQEHPLVAPAPHPCEVRGVSAGENGD
ncbi:conjugative transfer protein MobI(A/C) [Rhodanobacter sp. FW106-PBR-LB-2-11]|uniref:conjugative transfer protein MobI(A/C) n=1 Tax=Rhodanobacter sp. FW106-PBR-LB-2-11 TaxID=1524463 RepID=UPI0034E5390E